MFELLDDGNYTAGTNGSAAFTDSEGKTLLHSYGMDQFDGHLYVITRHAHLCASRQFANAGNVSCTEVELRSVVVEERCMTAAFILGQNVNLVLPEPVLFRFQFSEYHAAERRCYHQPVPHPASYGTFRYRLQQSSWSLL